MDSTAKALVAAVIGLLGAVVTGLADGHLTAIEWVVAALAGVTAGGAVFGVPNRPPAGEASDPHLSEQDPQEPA
jgi:hypothetical protein